MKTVILKNIKGVKVVCGFGRKVIDPEQTKKKINKKAKATKEYKSVNLLGAELLRLNSIKQLTPEIQTKKQSVTQKLLTAQEELKEVMVSIYQDEKTYFSPKKDEVEISDDQFAELSKMTKEMNRESQIIIFDEGFKLVSNHKGKKYFIKKGKEIKQRKIRNIGEEFPEGAFFELDEDQQLEFSGLDVKTVRLEEAMRESIVKKNEFEISGDTPEEALRKAREIYNTKTQEIETKYGA